MVAQYCHECLVLSLRHRTDQAVTQPLVGTGAINGGTARVRFSPVSGQTQLCNAIISAITALGLFQRIRYGWLDCIGTASDKSDSTKWNLATFIIFSEKGIKL